MAIYALSRDLSVPVSAPFSTIIGGFTDIIMSASGGFDFYTDTRANILGANSSITADWSYSVSWRLNLRVESAIPPSISAFPSTPERRYLGGLTFFGGEGIDRYEQINFTNQNVPGGLFFVAKNRNQALDGASQDYGGVGSVTTLAGLGTGRTSIGQTSFSSGLERFTHGCNWLFFPGVTIRAKMLYRAEITYESFSTTNVRTYQI